MSVFVVTHKCSNDMPILPKSYHWLIVGNARNNVPFPENSFRDDDWNGIASKNQTYCELTALYWIWKNCTSPVKGLVHYRRLFSQNWLLSKTPFPLSERSYGSILKKHDCIVPKKHKLPVSVYEQYKRVHDINDLLIIKSAIDYHCPEYATSFDSVMERDYFHPFNMLIAKAYYFDSYCSWLFPLLEFAEGRIDYSSKDPYQQRVIGFASERLLDVWLQYNNVDFLEKPVTTFDLLSRERFKQQ